MQGTALLPPWPLSAFSTKGRFQRGNFDRTERVPHSQELFLLLSVLASALKTTFPQRDGPVWGRWGEARWGQQGRGQSQSQGLERAHGRQQRIRAACPFSLDWCFSEHVLQRRLPTSLSGFLSQWSRAWMKRSVLGEKSHTSKTPTQVHKIWEWHLQVHATL